MLIDVAFVKRARRRQITYSIVLRLGCYGTALFTLLGVSLFSAGTCVRSLQREGEEFGKQGPYVYFGRFGRLGMLLFLGMRGCPYKMIRFFFVHLF